MGRLELAGVTLSSLWKSITEKVLPENQEAQSEILDRAEQQHWPLHVAARKVIDFMQLGAQSREALDRCLREHASAMAEAAVKDIQTIANSGEQKTSGLKTNWDVNRVNSAPEEGATRSEGAYAAAIIAKNIVLLANSHPEIAGEMKDAVSAAANLARGITYGPSDKCPLGSRHGEWLEVATKGLRSAVERMEPEKRPLNLEAFITTRMAEIKAAITQTLQAAPSKQKASCVLL